MSLKIELLIAVAFFVLFEGLGYSTFSACHDNGGNIVSCGLVAFLVGGVKVGLFVYALFWLLLIDGIAHLVGKS